VARHFCDAVLDHYDFSDVSEFAQSVECGAMLLDRDMKKVPTLMADDGTVPGGSTACAVWIFKDQSQIYSANVGDSRFILSYNGRAVPVTVDHKPSAACERARIARAGGYVENDRVNGTLGVARAFGDFTFKKSANVKPHEQPVIALPDVRAVAIDSSIDFMVIASDGVWDLMTVSDRIAFACSLVHQVTFLLRISKWWTSSRSVWRRWR